MKGSHIFRDILNTPKTLASRNLKEKQIPTKNSVFTAPAAGKVQGQDAYPSNQLGHLDGGDLSTRPRGH